MERCRDGGTWQCCAHLRHSPRPNSTSGKGGTGGPPSPPAQPGPARQQLHARPLRIHTHMCIPTYMTYTPLHVYIAGVYMLWLGAADPGAAAPSSPSPTAEMFGARRLCPRVKLVKPSPGARGVPAAGRAAAARPLPTSPVRPRTAGLPGISLCNL